VRTSLGPIYLFDVAARQAQWLSVRQAAIAGNVANANTPGYAAMDVEPFSDVMDKTQLAMAGSNPAHLGLSGSSLRPGDLAEAKTWDTVHSGNSVALEQEMIKAGEVNRGFALNTAIVQSFHRMLLMSVKG
jgi:flagellar basal-body rod protein FlgB